MGCGTGFMQVMLIIFNSIFLLAGLAGLGGGIWMAVNAQSWFDVIKVTFVGTEDFVRHAAYIFIAVSVFIAIIAALGFFGACCKNRCMLATYAAFVIILLILQIALIVVIAVFATRHADVAQDKAAESLVTAYKGSGKGENEFKNAVESFQKKFECCGIRGPDDYQGVTDKPASCNTYKVGCFEKVKAWVRTNLGLVIGITVAVIVFQIILVIFALCLRRQSDFGKAV